MTTLKAPTELEEEEGDTGGALVFPFCLKRFICMQSGLADADKKNMFHYLLASVNHCVWIMTAAYILRLHLLLAGPWAVKALAFKADDLMS